MYACMQVYILYYIYIYNLYIMYIHVRVTSLRDARSETLGPRRWRVDRNE